MFVGVRVSLKTILSRSKVVWCYFCVRNRFGLIVAAADVSDKTLSVWRIFYGSKLIKHKHFMKTFTN